MGRRTADGCCLTYKLIVKLTCFDWQGWCEGQGIAPTIAMFFVVLWVHSLSLQFFVGSFVEEDYSGCNKEVDCCSFVGLNSIKCTTVSVTLHIRNLLT